jgi:hypothetical protein
MQIEKFRTCYKKIVETTVHFGEGRINPSTIAILIKSYFDYIDK